LNFASNSPEPFNNQADYQCEDVYHDMENVEVLAGPYPYESFYDTTKKSLTGKEAKYFKKCEKIAKGNKALAYYFYDKPDMVLKTKKQAVKMHEKFMKAKKEFTVDNILSYF
jgi:hypothetical protein